MPHHLELIIALAVPLIVLTVLRINAALVFMSLCVGFVLVELVAKDANSLISFLAPTQSVSQTTWQLGMLLVPVVLTSIFTAFSMHGHWRAMFNVLPALGVSIVGVMMAIPLFTPGLRYAIQSESLWQQLNKAQAMVVGLSAFISLLFLWLQRRSSGHGEHRRR